MPFVYMLRCADGTYYTGWATNIERRVAEHNRGRGGRYTRSHGPVTLVYQEEVPDRSTALRREAEIKVYPREQKERLIAGGLPTAR